MADKPTHKELEQRVKALEKEIGIRQYIEKPFDKGKLSRLVREVLDHP